MNPGLLATAEPSASISVTIDGTAIHEGDLYTTDSDPTMNVSATAPDDRTLEQVTVQVDGYADTTISPDGTSFSDTVVPDLDHGNNTVKILVEDSAGDVTSHTFTVQKDTHPPTVYLTSPYYSDGYRHSSAEINTTNVTIAGVIDDLNEVTQATLTYDHEDTDYGGTMDVLNDSGKFSRGLVLGEGKNTLKLIVDDRFDNAAVYQYTITVNDTESPSLNVTSEVPSTTDSDTLVLEGTLADNVWVQNATVERSMNGSTKEWQLVENEGYSVSGDRLSLTFEQEVTLLNGSNTLNLTVKDSTGHSATENFTVDYTPPDDTEEDRAISVEINHEWTKFIDERTLQIVGTASGTDIGQLTIETFTADGTTVDYVIAHQGSQATDLSFETTVRTAPNQTRVLVRAFDPKRDGDTATVWVDPAQGDTVFNDRGAVFDTPTPSPTPTPTPRTIVKNNTKTPPTPTPQVETRVVTEVKEVNVTNSSAKKGGGGILGQAGRFAGGVIGTVKGWIDGAIGFVQSLIPLLALP